MIQLICILEKDENKFGYFGLNGVGNISSSRKLGWNIKSGFVVYDRKIRGLVFIEWDCTDNGGFSDNGVFW